MPQKSAFTAKMGEVYQQKTPGENFFNHRTNRAGEKMMAQAAI